MKTIGAFVAVVLTAASVVTFAQTNQQRRVALMRYQTGMDFYTRAAFADAERAFIEALRLHPRMGLAHYSLGRTYMAMKDFPRAVKALSDARDSFMAETTDRTIIRGDQADAADDERQALRQAADRAERARLSGGGGSASASGAAQRLLQEARQLEAATHRREQGSLELGVPPFVYLALGSAYFRQGLVEDAEREYRAAVKADPNFGEAHSNLAVVYKMTGRYDEAEKSVKAAEKVGFRVNPALKDEIRARKSAGS